MKSETNFLHRTIFSRVSNGMQIPSIFAVAIFAFPYISYAQTRACDQLESVVQGGLCLIVFLNQILVPFLFSLALLFFVYFMIRYFIIEINNADGKEKAKRYAIYSITGFVLMVSLWGVVNLLTEGFFGTNISDPVCPDSVPYCNSSDRSDGTITGGGGVGVGGGDSEGGDPSDDPLSPDPVAPIDRIDPLDEALDAALAAIISDINNSSLSASQKAQIIADISDNTLSDSLRLDYIKAQYNIGYTSLTHAQNYVNALNAIRQSAGEPVIFINLTNAEAGP